MHSDSKLRAEGYCLDGKPIEAAVAKLNPATANLNFFTIQGFEKLDQVAKDGLLLNIHKKQSTTQAPVK